MHTNKKVLIGIILILAILMGGVSAVSQVQASPLAGLSLGSSVVSEGTDFNVNVIGSRWWDMDGSPYPDFPTATQNIDRNTFKSQNGYWDINPSNTDPMVWMLWTGIKNTQSVLKMGDRFPIDANKYDLLSFYMCLDEAPDSNPNVDNDWATFIYWFYQQSPFSTGAPNGISNPMFFKQQNRFPSDGSCELIVFDMSHPSFAMQGSWDNNPQKPIGLRLDPINKNKDFQIHWMRLTNQDTSNTVDFNWTNAGSGPLTFYLSPSGCNQNGIPVGTVNNPSQSGTFKWGAQLQTRQTGWAQYPYPLPESFEPGTYSVYMVQGQDVTCSAQDLTIKSAPMLTFQKPGFTSGPDYASTVLNDPWGMRNSQDVSNVSGFSSVNYNNEFFNGMTSNSDPQLVLRDGSQGIDSSKYYNVSFRMYIPGQQSIGTGWVQRFLWWRQGPSSDVGTTQDMVIYEGWHTYSFDLRNAPLEAGSTQWTDQDPTTFRFDPLELPNPNNVHIDYVMLTGEETVTRGQLFPIYYSTDPANGANVTFYYDTDTNPNNGRTPMNTTGQAQPMEFLAFNIFLPLIQHSDVPEIDLYANSRMVYWNTAGVPLNTYYVSAVVSDGVNSTTWYSEVPVRVK